MKNKKSFYFKSITVDTTYQTYAETEIPETDNFGLSPNFDYKGKVKLLASNQFLNFNGACRLHHSCDLIPKAWINFSAEVDPEKIYIPVTKEPTSSTKDKLAASIMVTNDSTHLYSAFLSKIVSKNDVQVLPSDGFLFFDKSSQEYRIASKEKLSERALTGNYLSLNTKSCMVYGEGKMNFGTDIGQLKMDVVGSANHFLIPDSAVFDVMIGVGFYFEDNAIEKIADEITNKFSDLPAVSFARPIYEKGLTELLGKQEADKLISQVNLYGSFKKVPEELRYPFFLDRCKNEMEYSYSFIFI